MLPSPAVAGILSETFVEARHHTDHPDSEIEDRNDAFQLEMQGDNSLPYYMLLNPETNEVYGTYAGAALTTKSFVEFLEAGIAKSGIKKVARAE